MTEASLAKKFRARLQAADLGDKASHHSTILAESWSTMSTIAECIAVFADERDFITAMEREPMDFFTELEPELTLLKSRARDHEKTLKALLAAFYRQKRKMD
ncbi:MAG: hypothetical protein KGJ84_13385 [Elusimicrobia bacterium]|nr:hypothetical protein [Elusimicrobiota bacterium]